MQQAKHVGVYASIIKDGKILLIKKARGPYTGKLDLPGGSLEFGENPEEGLRREIKEETNLVADNIELANFFTHLVRFIDDNEEKEMYHIGAIYDVGVADGDLKTSSDGEDSEGADWYEIAGLDRSELSPFAQRIIK